MIHGHQVTEPCYINPRKEKEGNTQLVDDWSFDSSISHDVRHLDLGNLQHKTEHGQSKSWSTFGSNSTLAAKFCLTPTTGQFSEGRRKDNTDQWKQISHEGLMCPSGSCFQLLSFPKTLGLFFVFSLLYLELSIPRASCEQKQMIWVFGLGCSVIPTSPVILIVSV